MGNLNLPRIADDDLDLMTRIARHGFVDADYVYRFAYRNKKDETIKRRLHQLRLYEYILIERTFIPPKFTASYRSGYKIITLGKRGLHFIEDMGVEVKDNTKLIQTYSPYYMYHQVQVAMVCDTLKEAYEQGESNWYIDEILNEKEACLEETKNRPDAILVFKRKNQTDSPVVFVYLELEHSYSKQSTIERKIRAYKQAFMDELYEKHFYPNIVDHRVLFISKIRNEQQSLVKKIQEYSEKIGFRLLSVGYEDITNHPMENIYTLPLHPERKYKLMADLPL